MRELAADLLGGGVAVRDDFLCASTLRALVECVAVRRDRGEFAAAGIGAGRNRRERADIRGDSICWLSEPWFEAERRVLSDLEALRLDFNREALLGLFDLELQYARYEPGTGYARHLDQPLGREQRKVSMIVYLNADWRPGDGGELRLHGDRGRYRDIEPVGGRLVCFLTAGQEHEVLATRRDRLSLGGWLRSRA